MISDGSMEFQIEQLDVAGWRRGRGVRLRSLADTPDAFGATLDRENAFDDQRWVSRVARQDAATFVAVSVEGRDIGMVVMAPYEQQIGLFGIWVDAEARMGGVGGRLVDAGIDWARGRGFSHVFLDVGDGNRAAIALYESRGFLPTGESGSLPPPREHVREHQRRLVIARPGVGSGFVG